MSHVVVDPVTRIEGHLRIEAEVDGGQVQDAWSSSTMFRGIELILKGRDPRDAWAFAQRICGVCTTVHAIASVRSVENAIGAKPPPNARVLRNLIMASQCIQDHVIHFYHLHALDWVDVVSALKADPEKTSTLAQSISDWPLSSTKYFAGVKTRLKDFVDRGQLGPFANAYWGHPAYKLPPEANLMAVAHYLEALEWQRDFIKIHAILGGKNPHLQSFLVGGMATPVDPDKQASINMGSVGADEGADPQGEGVRQTGLPSGRARGGKLLQGLGSGGRRSRQLHGLRRVPGDRRRQAAPLPAVRHHPEQEPGQGRASRREQDHRVGETQLVRGQRAAAPSPRRARPGPNTPGPSLRTSGWRRPAKYSWLKSPRYGGEPMEVGPLARMLVAYGSGHKRVQELVGTALKSLGVGPEALFSTLGRIAARCVETVLLVEKIDTWVDALAANMDKGDLAHPRHREVGSVLLAEGGLRRRVPRGAPRRTRPLGAHQGWNHRQLPVHRPEHLECRSPRRGG